MFKSPPSPHNRKKLKRIPSLIQTESVKRIVGGRWRDFCFTQPLVWRNLERPAENRLRRLPNPRPSQLPSALRPVLEKPPPLPPHPLGQIRNNPQAWAELLNIGRSLFASQFSVWMKSQISLSRICCSFANEILNHFFIIWRWQWRWWFEHLLKYCNPSKMTHFIMSVYLISYKITLNFSVIWEFSIVS